MKESSDTQQDVIVGIGARVDDESFRKATALATTGIRQKIENMARDMARMRAAREVGQAATDAVLKTDKELTKMAKNIETPPAELRAKGLTAKEIAAAEVSGKTLKGKKRTQKANAESGITGIVGIYAFRHATRLGQEFLKTIIQLRIENDKLTKGYSKLGSQLKTFNARVKGIKTNLGSLVSSILEPSLNVFNTLLAYIGSFTKRLSKLPTPLKEIMGFMTASLIIIPIITGLIFILRYYLGRVNATMIVQAEAGSLLAKVWVNYGKSILTVTKYLIFAIIMTMALVNLFKKVEESAKDAGKGLSSFDDVNILQQGEGGVGQELQDSLDKATKSAKALSVAILAIGTAWTAINIVKDLKDLKNSLFVSGQVLAVVAVLTSLYFIGKNVIDTIKTIKEIWGNMSVPEKIITGLLTFTTVLIGVAGAIMLVWGALTRNWAMIIGGVLSLGAGIGASFGISAIAENLKNKYSKQNEIKTVPAAAHGAVVKSATVTMVGEGKYSEAIVPLGNSPEFTTMKQDITNAVLAGLGQTRMTGQPINVIVNVDKDYIYKSYNQVAKQNGVK